MSAIALPAIFHPAAHDLGAAALVSFGLARPLAAQAPPLAATSHNYTYSTVFTTPTNFLPAQAGDIRFVFAPDGPNPVSAEITGGSLSFSGDWGINLFGITTCVTARSAGVRAGGHRRCWERR